MSSFKQLLEDFHSTFMCCYKVHIIHLHLSAIVQQQNAEVSLPSEFFFFWREQF